MKFTDLTEAQQEQFTEYFYDYSPLQDQDSPLPWGAPWNWCNEEIDSNLSMKELAENFVLKNIDELHEIIRQDKEGYE